MTAAAAIAVGVAIVAFIAMVVAIVSAIEASTKRDECAQREREAHRHVCRTLRLRDQARQEFAKQCHQFALEQAPELWPGERSRQEGRRDG